MGTTSSDSEVFLMSVSDSSSTSDEEISSDELTPDDSDDPEKSLSLSSITDDKYCCPCKKLYFGNDGDEWNEAKRYKILLNCSIKPTTLKHLAIVKILNSAKNFNATLLDYIHTQLLPLKFLYGLEFKVITYPPYNYKVTFEEIENYFTEDSQEKIVYLYRAFSRLQTKKYGPRFLATCSCLYHNRRDLVTNPDALPFFVNSQRVIEAVHLPRNVHTTTCKKA